MHFFRHECGGATIGGVLSHDFDQRAADHDTICQSGQLLHVACSASVARRNSSHNFIPVTTM